MDKLAAEQQHHAHHLWHKLILFGIRITRASLYLHAHALATYHPLIEDEFVMSKASAWRKEMKNTDKVIKRKEKKYEKETIRELKKDASAI